MKIKEIQKVPHVIGAVKISPCYQNTVQDSSMKPKAGPYCWFSYSAKTFFNNGSKVHPTQWQWGVGSCH